MLMITIEAEPVDMVIIQLYMPTSDHEESEVEDMYEQLEELITKEKGDVNVVVMGDWNAVVGEGGDGKKLGNFSLGKRNDRGQLMLDFCRRMKMVVTNTLFKQEKRRRYTWIRPGDSGGYQLDYILVRQRFRNSVKNAKSYPGADVYSDHNLVMMNVEVKLKKVKKGQRRKRWLLEGIEGKIDAFQTE